MKTATVKIIAISEFARENFHVTSRYGEPIWEKFVAIDMVADNGERLRNFTKFNTTFAGVVRVGDEVAISYRVKDVDRACPETGVSYTAVTYCQIGQTKVAAVADKREAKRVARLRKLGLA